MTLLEMTLNAPGFKAFCRRRINGRSLNHAQRYAAAVKAEQSKFRAFCKRRGPLSVLLGDDMTRRGRGAGVYPIGNGEYAQLKKINGEFVSVYEPAPIETPADEITRDAEQPAAEENQAA